MTDPLRPPAVSPLAPRFAALHVRDYRWYFIASLLAMTADNIEHVISYWVIFPNPSTHASAVCPVGPHNASGLVMGNTAMGALPLAQDSHHEH